MLLKDKITEAVALVAPGLPRYVLSNGALGLVRMYFVEHVDETERHSLAEYLREFILPANVLLDLTCKGEN
jgi:hypothetical protein